MFRLPFFEKASFRKTGLGKYTRDDPAVELFVFLFVMFSLFVLLLIRLFQLTIVKGSYFRRLSEENRLKEILVEPKRGTIVDQKGTVLAKNLPADLQKNEDRLVSKRVYSESLAISHIVGYRQKADKKDFTDDTCIFKLKLGDKVGKKGVENIFECELRGRPGKKLIEVDARGKFLRTVFVIPPSDVEPLTLALDLELQKKARELLKDKKGAIVALQPKTGEILALFSAPVFNPQDFEDNNEHEVKRMLVDSDNPLFNRATEGLYPPGSIFKLFIATGALEDKKITKETKIEDTGTVTAGPLTFGNWYFLQYGKKEGEVDVVKGIRRSNDIFFYKVGERLGPSRIKFWAERFGFGKKSSLPFPQEEGMVPSPFWKEEILKDRWYLGDTYNLSIGQGYVLVTPFQVAQATSVFANGGFLCKPHLLKNDIGDCRSLGISSETLALVREGMKQACSPGGTGWPLFEFKPQTACKTGTAEAPGKTKVAHAWITVFAPFENPEIVVTVLVEEGGQGSDVAGPIAKELLKTYFEQSK